MSAAAIIASQPARTVVPGHPAPRQSSPHAIQPLAFCATPSLFTALFFAMGISLTRVLYEPPPLALLMVLLAAFAALAANRIARRLSLAPLALACIAAGILCAEVYPLPDPQTQLLSYSSRVPVQLYGEVVRAGAVRITDSTAPFASHSVKERSQTLDLRIKSVSGNAAIGGVRMALYAADGQSFPVFRCGDMMRVSAAIHPPERYNDPGVWDARAYLRLQGIGAIGSAKVATAAIVATTKHPSLACRLKALQQAASGRVMELASSAASGRLPAFLSLTTEDASMLAAMVTGDREWLQRRTRVGFERTGSFHLLVVSGLHLAIFAGIIFWFAQRIQLSTLWASLLTIVSAFAYAVFTGFGQPVQRSFWMVTLYLLGRLLFREKSALNAIGFAALCLLAANPPGLFEAGFQMTLLSVLAIAGIAMPIAEHSFAPYLRATRNLLLLAIDPSLPPTVAQFRVSLRLLGIHLKPLIGSKLAFAAPAFLIGLFLRVCELLLVSVIVEAVMSLPMAIYFHRITVLALPVNFLIVPFLGLLLPFALLTFAALLVSAKAAAIPAAFTAGLLHSVTGLIHIFAAMRGSDLRIPGPSAASILAFILLLAFAVYAARMRRFAIPSTLAALSLMALAVVLPRPMDRHRGMLEVTAIDVGQGDSLLILTPDGKTLLIDAGGSPFGPPPGLANFDIGEEVVSAYLWSRGIRRLDAVALTHAHADHIGGMPAVMANFRPRELWVGNNPHSEAYDALLIEGCSVGSILRHYSAGNQFSFGDAQIEVLAPDANYHPATTPTNNDSLVLRIQYGHTSALLEGDAEVPSEERMVREGLSHSDLLKVGHHGSRTSTTPAFLTAVSPGFAAISVGARNFYGHPRIEVLDQLETDHVRTYRTDALGLSTFYLTGLQVVPAPMPASSH